MPRKKLSINPPEVLTNQETPPPQPLTKEQVEARKIWLAEKEKIILDKLELASGEKVEILKGRLENIKKELTELSNK